MPLLPIKAEKVTHKHTKSGGVTLSVLEHYLRDDLSCHSAVCKLCSQQISLNSSSVVAATAASSSSSSSSVLPADVSHYVVPDVEVSELLLMLVVVVVMVVMVVMVVVVVVVMVVV